MTRYSFAIATFIVLSACGSDSKKTSTTNMTCDAGVACDDAGNTAGSKMKLVSLATGLGHSCVIVDGGVVKCWGWNYYGQLGNDSTVDAHTPVAVNGLGDVRAITASNTSNFTCALMMDGTVKCWGENPHGALGNDSTAESHVPVSVKGLTNVIAISAGVTHTCALIDGGTVQCWGANENGQLGNNLKDDSHVPVSVSGLTGVTMIAAGSGHTCAVVEGGAVKCWGGNGSGQLGNDSTDPSLTPVSVSGLSGVKAIAAYGYTCAVLDDGTEKCWGQSPNGLGNATLESHVPVGVTGISGATALAVGVYGGCTVVTNGGVMCWGDNSAYGGLGNDSTSGSATPVSVSMLTGATSVATGDGHVCAFINTGSIKCWGRNDFGQLGNNTTDVSHVPVNVIF